MQVQTRSHVSTFVHSLHLLNLDQREDWPEVSVDAFDANASLQHRIRCVEWSLYRLFELYDPRSTRDKLRPFFPTSTSLQSVNLRAALLRQLTELKKNGVLGPNVLLRKTMLDECKGDKFEEVLAALSIVVLRQSTAAQNSTFASLDPAHAVPLILAYRKTVQCASENRARFALHAQEQHKSLDVAIKTAVRQEEALKRRRPGQQPKNSDTLRDLVRQSWIGDDGWVEAILHGIPPRPESLSGSTERQQPRSRLVTDLHTRLQEQNARLDHWHSFLAKVRARQPSRAASTRVRVNNNDGQLRITKFGLHKGLNLSSRAVPADDLPLKQSHMLLLEALERELAPRTEVSTTTIAPKSRTVTPTKPANQIPKQASRPTPTRAESLISGISSQDTIVADTEDELTPVKSVSKWRSQTTPPDDTPKPNWSLQDRTKTSITRHRKTASFATTQQGFQILKSPGERQQVSAITKQPYDRERLTESTRQSMSKLKNVLDDAFEARQPQPRPRKPSHHRSQTAVHLSSHLSQSSQRRRLERAWSEESLASTATKEGLDLDADYDSVFKSRPRLAMSPNLSPQQSSNDLWLETQLEEGMNRLAIDSSPEY